MTLITRLKTKLSALITRYLIAHHKAQVSQAMSDVYLWNSADCSFNFACSIGMPSATRLRDRYNHHIRRLRELDPNFPPNIQELP